MGKKSRTHYTITNLVVGMGGQMVNTILSFISRTLFIKFMAIEYLGLNSLFTEILTVLSLAELGVGSAITYALYKPLLNKDEKKISALMRFYKKCYMCIGIFITIVGLALIPFLKYIVEEPKNIEINLYIIYVLYLLNTSVSYFFSYKTTLLEADQKRYIGQTVGVVVAAIKTVLQIVIIAVTRNFYLYVMVQLLSTIIVYVVQSIYVNRHYGYINSNKAETIDKKTLRGLIKNVKSLVIIRISSILVNSTDNMIISALKGIVSVGILSNYNLITQVIGSILQQVFDSMTGSVGNLNAEGNREKSEKIFRAINMLNFWLFGWAAIGIAVLGNDIISIWLGETYTLSKYIVYILAINFYIKGMQNAVWTFKHTYGLFQYGRYLLVGTAVINLVLSIGLGKRIGIAGVLIATSISRILTNVWYEPYAVYKYGFKDSVSKYYKNYVLYFTIIVISYILCVLGIDCIVNIGINNFYFKLIIKFIIVLIVPVGIVVLLFRNKDEYKYLKTKIGSIVPKILKKISKK